MEQLGLMLQVQLIPYYARQLGELSSGFRNVPVLIDHFGLVARGRPTGIRRRGRPEDAAVLHEDLAVTAESEAHGAPGIRRVWTRSADLGILWQHHGRFQ